MNNWQGRRQGRLQGRRRARLLGGVATVVTVLLAVAAVAGVTVATAQAHGDDETPGDTIVRVKGDAANGFEIYYRDGSELFPPTDSEAIAECDEYDGKLQRVRCRTEVRIWYRDLADMKQTIQYIRKHPHG